MQTPDNPPEEEKRLRTLQAMDILDSPHEDRFDRLTRMAKRMFDVPVALVCLIDENRQWFKSCIGLNVTETARDISFCGHAILDNKLFIIEDTHSDDRFKDNPLVLGEPYIRFYAGCPIRSMDGSKLGTVCIIDRVPRQLDAEDIQILHDLAELTESEIAAIELSLLDELTGAVNRRGFMASAKHLLNFSIRQNLPACLVFIDLNDFKQINDRFGHAEGDLTLMVFVDHIKSVLRDSDLLARVGGDEFVLLLLNISGEMAEAAVSRTSRLIDQYNKKVDRGYEISFSYGMVVYDPESHKDVDALLADGDSKMYENKYSSQSLSKSIQEI